MVVGYMSHPLLLHESSCVNIRLCWLEISPQDYMYRRESDGNHSCD